MLARARQRRACSKHSLFDTSEKGDTGLKETHRLPGAASPAKHTRRISRGSHQRLVGQGKASQAASHPQLAVAVSRRHRTPCHSHSHLSLPRARLGNPRWMSTAGLEAPVSHLLAVDPLLPPLAVFFFLREDLTSRVESTMAGVSQASCRALTSSFSAPFTAPFLSSPPSLSSDSPFPADLGLTDAHALLLVASGACSFCSHRLASSNRACSLCSDDTLHFHARPLMQIAPNN